MCLFLNNETLSDTKDFEIKNVLVLFKPKKGTKLSSLGVL